MADKEELTSDIIEDFAETVIGGDPVEKKDIIYGEVVEKNGTFYAKVDGSVALSPMNYSVEVEDGDRVMFQMKNRTLTAVGNITAPASARTATNFIKLTDDGFMVGELDDNGVPTGSYTLMKHDSFHIVDKTGQILASFDRSAVSFGNKASFGENGVVLRNGAGNILATFTETGATICNKYGQELAKFDQNGILFKNSNGFSLAYFGNDGITLYDSWGHPLAVLNQGGVTFKNSSGYTIANFGGSGVTLYNTIGKALASFGGEGAVIYGAGNKPLATFNSSGFNMYSGDVSIASFTASDGVVFRDDSGRLLATMKKSGMKFYDSYSGTELVSIATSGIYLKNLFGSMASFTPSGVTIGNSSFTSNGVSLNGGKAVFDTDGVTLKSGDGAVVIAKFTKSGVDLRDSSGTTVLTVNSEGISLPKLREKTHSQLKCGGEFRLHSDQGSYINMGTAFSVERHFVSGNEYRNWKFEVGNSGFTIESYTQDDSNGVVTNEVRISGSRSNGRLNITAPGGVYVNGTRVH